MSFSPRNVSQLVVAKTEAAVNAGAAAGAFVVNAVKDIAAASGELANKGVNVMVKSATGVKVTDFIPANATYVEKTIEAGQSQSIELYVHAGSEVKSKTYGLTITAHDNIGSMLNERYLSAYVVTDKEGNFVKSDGTKEAGNDGSITIELGKVLAATAKQDGDNFLVSTGMGKVTVVANPPTQVVGVIDGIANPFEFTGGIKKNDFAVEGDAYFEAYTVNTELPQIIDGLVQLKNIEWFNSGYDKDAYRENGYPSSFAVDSNITAVGVAVGDTYGIFQFYKDRDATNVERQHRQLIVVGAGAAVIKTALDAKVA